MPWEKTFNEDKAVDAAMNLFWEKGYNDTSMADLLKATGLTKGSFYNAFGSKHALFEKSLLKYDTEFRCPIIQKLSALDNPVKAIRDFMDTIVEDTIQDPDKKGCFIINSSLSITTLEEDVQKIVQKAFTELEVFFKQMIELGQLRGEIGKDLDPQKCAKHFVGTIVSIRVLGRGLYDEKALRSLADQSLKILSYFFSGVALTILSY